jgi:sporulation protein YlmC with PRC-barrel domain
MDISIGATVYGTDGRLGDITALVAETETDRVVALVIKPHARFGQSHMIPLALVSAVQGSTSFAEIDRATFEGQGTYVGVRRADDIDYTGPPSSDAEGTYRGNLQMDAVALSGGRMQGKPMGFPGGEALSPEDMSSARIGLGAPILCSDGARVGELGGLSVAHDTGAPTRLIVRTGHLFKHETELPADWIRDLSARGVLLRVGSSEATARIKHDARAG